MTAGVNHSGLSLSNVSQLSIDHFRTKPSMILHCIWLHSKIKNPSSVRLEVQEVPGGVPPARPERVEAEPVFRSAKEVMKRARN